ncbi:MULTISPECIES: hypothetical protein [unclassified Nocardia]|uniref:hypothetical protein n=1 Tax=unclassified Nocardia TaxID=2637762 RepID=UPI0024A93C14|nr:MULTISPECIES: hypothetical protein [unclassified Nocardia]
MSWDIDQQQWHHLLSERNMLRSNLATIIDALLRHHDDHHVGAARWCENPLCQLLFRLHLS